MGFLCSVVVVVVSGGQVSQPGVQPQLTFGTEIPESDVSTISIESGTVQIDEAERSQSLEDAQVIRSNMYKKWWVRIQRKRRTCRTLITMHFVCMC